LYNCIAITKLYCNCDIQLPVPVQLQSFTGTGTVVQGCSTSVGRPVQSVCRTVDVRLPMFWYNAQARLLGVQNCTRTSVQVYRCRWTTPVLRCYNSFSPLVLAAEFQVQSFWYWCSAKYLQDNFPPPRPLQRTHYPLSTKRGKGEERTAVLKLFYTHCAFEFASASRNLLVLSLFSHCTASHTSVRSASATCLRLSLPVAVVPA